MKAVLFDMDGTLLDLDVDIERVRKALAQLFGARGYRGGFTPILASIDEAARTVADSDVEREELVRRARQLIDDAECRAASRATARPGAKELVADLVDIGCPFGLITDNGRACLAPALASAELDRVSWPAGAVVSRDEVPRPKPAPDGIRAVASQLLPEGGTLWYVGDSPKDIAACRAARPMLPQIEIRMVAVEGGRGRAEDLHAMDPDLVIPHLGELWSVLR